MIARRPAAPVRVDPVELLTGAPLDEIDESSFDVVGERRPFVTLQLRLP